MTERAETKLNRNFNPGYAVGIDSELTVNAYGLKRDCPAMTLMSFITEVAENRLLLLGKCSTNPAVL